MGYVNNKGEEQSKNVEDDTVDANRDSTLQDAKTQNDTSNEIPTHKQFIANNNSDVDNLCK